MIYPKTHSWFWQNQNFNPALSSKFHANKLLKTYRLVLLDLKWSLLFLIPFTTHLPEDASPFHFTETMVAIHVCLPKFPPDTNREQEEKLKLSKNTPSA